MIYVSCLFIFCHALKGESVLEKTPYPQLCRQAIERPEVFHQFRRHPASQALDIPYETGLAYLTFIGSHYPDLLDRLDACRNNDVIGDPILNDYERFGRFSPQTLRYIKVAGDCKTHFGDLSNRNIIEIGGGYGGLCNILHALGGFASYTIVNLPECNALAKKFLAAQGIENVNFIDINQWPDHELKCDLLISCYAFSEFDSATQKACLHYLIKGASNGYLNLNSISKKFGIGSLSLNQVVAFLYETGKQGVVEEEAPLTHPDNVTVIWKSGREKRSSSTPLKQTNSNALTYELSGGRLGDNLIAYLHAKWISYKHSIPLVFLPFPYSEAFQCHDEENHTPPKHLTSRQLISNELQFATMHEQDSTLFCLPYSPESAYDYRFSHLHTWLPYIQVDWEDPLFKEQVRKMLTLKEKTQTFSLPQNEISVAVHVRRGGGVDDPKAYLAWPLKFPPDSYYIEQIQRIDEIFCHQPLYVYLFTDDLDPPAIRDRYQAAIDRPNIRFACRESGNGPQVNVLDDFYMMTQFDCLIRSDSNLSIVASKLADYKVMIAPSRPRIQQERWIFLKKRLFIDQVQITFNGKSLWREILW